MRILPILGLIALAACTTPPDVTGSQMGSVSPIKGPSPQRTSTPVKEALQCVGKYRNKGQDLRLAIGDIVDGTGARTFTDGASTLLPQRPDMMFTVAMHDTGLKILNRNATKVAEWEMVQSMEKRLGEGRKTKVDDKEFAYRPVEAGSMLGSTHYVTGALTEVNWNIYSSEVKNNIAGGFQKEKEYYISVAVDLMVTDTRTTEITLARSYTKQIVGKELSNGLFRFFDIGDQSAGIGPLELFDSSAGAQSNEPVQNAVRWLMATAAYDIASTLTHTAKRCDDKLLPEPPAALEEETPTVASKTSKSAQPSVTKAAVAPVATAEAETSQTAPRKGWFSKKAEIAKPSEETISTYTRKNWAAGDKEAALKDAPVVKVSEDTALRKSWGSKKPSPAASQTAETTLAQADIASEALETLSLQEADIVASSRSYKVARPQKSWP